MKDMYDFLLVGAGWYDATLAYILSPRHRVLVIDRRLHIGGNCHTKNRHGINIHKYGAHIFHTNNKRVWDFVNMFAEFNRYTNSPIANYNGEIYNLPFNMTIIISTTVIREFLLAGIRRFLKRCSKDQQSCSIRRITHKGTRPKL